jgi:hypothetical protein
VKYELGFYIPEDDILHSHRQENLTPYIELTCVDYESCLKGAVGQNEHFHGGEENSGLKK